MVIDEEPLAVHDASTSAPPSFTDVVRDGKLPHPCLFAQFNQPLLYARDFPLRVRMHKISLEYCIYGFCTEFTAFVRVLNSIAVQCVFARFTVDDWRSCTDVQASLVTKMFRGENSDRYVCDIPYINPGPTEFALCVKTKDNEWWDNNSSKNYRVGIIYN